MALTDLPTVGPSKGAIFIVDVLLGVFLFSVWKPGLNSHISAGFVSLI